MKSATPPPPETLAADNDEKWNNDEVKEIFDFCHRIITAIKRKEYAALVLVAIVFFTYHFNRHEPTTSPNVEVSGDGAVGIGGDNSGDITTNVVRSQDPEPMTEYSIISPSTLLDDGLYHTGIEVRVAFAKDGALHIHSDIDCTQNSVNNRMVHRKGVDVFYGVGTIWNLSCTSELPLIEDQPYFTFINYLPAANEE